MQILPKTHPNLLSADQTILVVIDMQEPFLRTIHERERLLQNVRILMQGANILRVPIVATTQYAEKMGEIIPELKRLLPTQLPPFDKMTFDCLGSLGFDSEIRRSGRRQVLLCGVETHICVSQTAHGLAAAGLQPHIVADAVSSRSETNWRFGLEKMRQCGTLISSVEMALYELLHQSGTEDFREILKLIK